MKVAVVGLGTMGAPMARNLLAAGHTVVVHNRTRERETEVPGAERAATPREAAAAVEVVLSCVSDTPDARAVLVDGDDCVLRGLARGGLVIDASTIAPEGARAIGAAFAAAGIDFVDAPVSGGSEGAEKGTLAIMCGGEEAAVERARPIFDVIGGCAVHVGPLGAGQVAKAVNQVVIAGTYAAVAEGVVLATKMGVDPRRVREAIRGGAAASWVLEQRGPNMIEDSYPLGFRLSLHRKDLGIALDAARSSEAALPVTALVASLEDGLLAQGHGDEDMSAIARAIRRLSALPEGPLEGSEG